MRFPRASGVLLHLTSLPGPHGSGDLGPAAYHFVDWLAVAGQRRWQVLPLTGIGPGNSPYMSSSAFAGNPLLVDLAELHEQGWLTSADMAAAAATSGLAAGKVNFAAVVPMRSTMLARAAARFAAAGTPEQRADFEAFRTEQASWLADYALFMALDEANDRRPWWTWNTALARREPAALAAARSTHAARIALAEFGQWRFLRQWQRLHAHARSKGVAIVGDIPIFIAAHSAEVWARPDLFELDASGRPPVVAGVPPDYFSATGQRWGNPLYRWAAHAQEGYAWWIERMRRILALVDIVRIDHFRGFVAHWEIPADEPTAINGRWVEGPGEALFAAVSRALSPNAGGAGDDNAAATGTGPGSALPIIAEDLGIITPDVEALRRKLGFPGMAVLHFAFSGDAKNRYLPHHHEPALVVYGGTHDNDTTAGWWAGASDAERSFARGYLDTDGHDMPWTLIRCAMASVADTCVHAMQDVLGLPSACRMNHPGQASGWWSWRFQWSEVQHWHGERLAELARLYGR
ncbi:MAG: 4-alpha-glucanotransferase [Rubrivivax sp.]